MSQAAAGGGAGSILLVQMVGDASSYPGLFPTEKAQENERQRLFRIIEDLVLWENTTNEEAVAHPGRDLALAIRRQIGGRTVVAGPVNL